MFGNTDSMRHGVNSDIVDTLMRLVDSFLIVVNMRGQVVVVSSCIERQLGHCQVNHKQTVHNNQQHLITDTHCNIDETSATHNNV